MPPGSPLQRRSRKRADALIRWPFERRSLVDRRHENAQHASCAGRPGSGTALAPHHRHRCRRGIVTRIGAGPQYWSAVAVSRHRRRAARAFDRTPSRRTTWRRSTARVRGVCRRDGRIDCVRHSARVGIAIKAGVAYGSVAVGRMDLNHLEVVALLDHKIIGVQIELSAFVRSSAGLHVSHYLNRGR